MSKTAVKLTKAKKAELEAQKELRNDMRRTKYQTDKDYRTKKLLESRESYRRANGFTTKAGKVDIKGMSKLAVKRGVLINKEPKKMGTFTTAELAGALNLSPLTLYRMHADNRIPKPALALVYAEGRSDRKSEKVYAAPEALAIAKVYFEHHEHYLHYRKSHTDTMRRMNASVNAVRKEMKNG